MYLIANRIIGKWKIRLIFNIKEQENSNKREMWESDEHKNNIRNPFKLSDPSTRIEEDRVQIRLGRNMYNHFGKIQNIIIMVDDQDITSEDGVVDLGQMNIVINDGEIYVGDIVIPEKYRGQGIATIVYQKISDYFGLPIVNSKTKGRNQLDQGGQIWKNREKFEPRNIQESIRRIRENVKVKISDITESEFPTELDIQEIFYDLTDEEPLSECKLYESGYQFFTCENLRLRPIRSQLFYDMSFEENWINKECKDINDTWKNIFIDLFGRVTIKRYIHHHKHIRQSLHPDSNWAMTHITTFCFFRGVIININDFV
jgi:predicted GNAT family acetyltransferase